MIPHAAEQLVPWTRTLTQLFHLCPRPQEQHLLKPESPRAPAAQQEKPPHLDAGALQLESGLHAAAGEQPLFAALMGKPAQS